MIANHDISKQLLRLAKLHKDGILTDEEFTELKAKLIETHDLQASEEQQAQREVGARARQEATALSHTVSESADRIDIGRRNGQAYSNTRDVRPSKLSKRRGLSMATAIGFITALLVVVTVVGIVILDQVTPKDDCEWLQSRDNNTMQQKMALLPLEKRLQFELQIAELGFEQLFKGIDGIRDGFEGKSQSNPGPSSEETKKALCAKVRKIIEPIYKW